METADVIHTIHIVDPHGEYAAAFDINRYAGMTGRHEPHGDQLAERGGDGLGTPKACEGLTIADVIPMNDEGTWCDPATGDKLTPQDLRNRFPDMANMSDEELSWGAAIWELTGTTQQLTLVYTELTGELASPAWHWYGMGGDDHCYDYWPNSMTMAAGFRDILTELWEDDDPHEQRIKLSEDLTRVYWLCRMRYVAEKGCTRHTDSGIWLNADGTPGESRLDVDNYFELDILSHDNFGDRPAWIEF